MNAQLFKQEFRWKRSKKGKYLLNICKQVLFYTGASVVLTSTTLNFANANPQDGVVISGGATITDTATELQIHQSTDRALIEWGSFNIDAGETTHFYQPSANSIALNRVVNASQLGSIIDGNLIANGRVVIINPNGVLIGPNGNIDTAAFIATSADIADEAFMDGGTLNFDRAGSLDAVVENQGSISVGEEGLAGLVAPTVRNNGVIRGNLAKIQLASADTFAVDFYGDGLIQFAVETPAEGETRTLTTENNGSIIADGGQVLMTAAAASDVVDAVINTDGYIQAGSLQNQGGKIVLTGAGATVKVSGKIDASGTGDNGGGEILIGGDYQGQGDLAKADSVEITDTAEIYADAGDNGDGGKIVVWSEKATTSRGKYYSRGGSVSGDGGLVETSSKALLDVDGSSVNTLADNGSAGDWLLDPDNILISNAGVSYVGPLPATGTSTIDVATINAALSNVILAANNGITVGADVNMTSAGAGLTLIAGINGVGIDIPDTGSFTELQAGQGTINFTNQFIRTNGGAVTFYSGNSITQNNATIYTDGGDITMISGSIGINNNAALGAYGGNVLLRAIEAGTGSSKTSGTISTNSSSIDTTDPSAPGIGGIILTQNGVPLAQGSYGNPQNVFVESANGGTITIEGKKIGGNSICFAAGGPGCSVLDPIATNIIVTIDSFNKIYGVADPLFTWGITSGSLTGGDTLNVDLARILQGLLAGEQVGTYDIYQTAYNVIGGGLYNITFVNGLLTIVPASVVIKAIDQTKTYGDALVLDETNPGDFTVTGLVSSIGGNATGDAVSTVNLTSTGLVASANAGNYIVTASGASGTNLSNYNITYQTGDLTVNKALLTATADDKSMTYGGTFPTLTATYTGFVNGENSGVIDTLASLASGTAATADAGTYVDTLTASGALDNNYNFSYVAGDLTIGKALLTVTADDKSMTYGGLAPTLTDTVTGFVNGDSAGVIDTTGTVASGTLFTADAGIYTDTLNSSGYADNNYSFVYVGGDLTIGKALLTVTSDDKSMTYGGTFPTLTATYTGFVNGENSGVIDTLASLASGTAATADAGVYIDTLTASGAIDNNYNFAYVAGDLTINKALLGVNVDDKSMAYGGTFPTLTATYTGFVNGDVDESVVDTLATLASGTAANADAGTYVDTLTASGASDNNYEFTYSFGDLTINKAKLLVTANDDTKVFDDLGYIGGNGVAYSGFVNGDDALDLGGSIVYAGSSQGAANVVGSPYDIEISGLTSNNYTIGYADGALTITPADITFTIFDQIKTEGTEFIFNNTEYTVSGLQGDDSITSAALFSLGQPIAAALGDYDINGTFFVGPTTLTSNYTPFFNIGTLSVIPAPVVANPVVPYVKFAPLSRPIISVANQAIVLDESFEEIETLEIATNVGISSSGSPQTTPEALAGITPAAGDEASADEQIASIEPAAGGNDDQQGEEGDEYAQDIACANSFLDNKPCETDQNAQ